MTDPSVDPRYTPYSQRRILPFSRENYTKVLAFLSAYATERGGSFVHVSAMLIQVARETGGSFDPRQVELAPLLSRKDSRGRNVSAVRANVLGVGGFGLQQWTGMRARRLIGFADNKGTSATDVETQLSYWRTELDNADYWKDGRTSIRAFWASKTVEEAALVYTRDFLRPAVVNQRVAMSGGRRLPRGWQADVRRVSGSAPIANQPTERDIIRAGQALLNASRGSGLVVDGIWGPRTANAAALAAGGEVSKSQFVDISRRAMAIFKRDTDDNQSVMV